MPTNDGPDTSLVEMIVSPTIWAVHFLLCYIVAAVHCAKMGLPAADLGPVRVWVAVVTLLALFGIAHAMNQQSFGNIFAYRHA